MQSTSLMLKCRPKIATVLLVLFICALPAIASELALLRNGFSVRHEHRELRDGTTRLYLGPGNESFVDVPTGEIVGFEPAPFEPQSPNPGPSSTSLSLEDAVSAA